MKPLAKTRPIKSVPAAMKALDRLAIEVREAETFEVLDDIARYAAALQMRFKPVKNVADRAGEVWIAAEVRVGLELAKLPKAKGTRGTLRGKPKGERGSSGRALVEPPDESAPTLAELGVAKKRAARARKLAEMPDEQRDTLAAELKADEKEVTPDALLRKQREHNKREKKFTTAAAVFSAAGPFGCVVIDPPWDMSKIDRDVRPNQDAFEYETMTEEQIADFWKAEVAGRIAPDCHLFMWTTQRFLPAAITLLDRIDFRYVLTMVWHKSGGFQPIDLPQYNCEFIVYGRRGKPLFVDTKNFFCCFEAPRREHSRKPDKFYEVIGRVTGGSRIDIYSRESREGFAQYGNEVGKFDEAAA